jgi:hypothetical protein
VALSKSIFNNWAFTQFDNHVNSQYPTNANFYDCLAVFKSNANFLTHHASLTKIILSQNSPQLYPMESCRKYVGP